MMFRFVSLGCDCQPAAQINRQQPSPIAHFFDWLGSTLQGLMKLIENDFDGFLDEKNLHPFFVDNAMKTVVDYKYKIDITHDLHNLRAEELKRVRAIYTMRARWFRELFEEDSPPTYFVRRWDGRDPDDGDAGPLALLSMLQERRSDVRLLYLHADRARAPSAAPGFRSAFLAQPHPFIWSGSEPAWREALLETAMTPHAGDGDAFALPLARVPRFA